MSDLTITVAQLQPLATVLSAIATLSPPPKPKGRYVLTKALPTVVAAYQRHETSLAPMLDDFATQDAEGKPIFHAKPDGSRTFAIRPEKVEEWTAIQAETVTLEGVRMITRAEFGDCPVTVDQEMVLVSCGLLEDAEPA